MKKVYKVLQRKTGINARPTIIVIQQHDITPQITFINGVLLLKEKFNLN